MRTFNSATMLTRHSLAVDPIRETTVQREKKERLKIELVFFEGHETSFKKIRCRICKCIIDPIHLLPTQREYFHVKDTVRIVEPFVTGSSACAFFIQPINLS